MGKAAIFIILFFVLVGVLAIIYFTYEKPIKDDVESITYTNLTIFAKNQNGDFIKTGYEIYLNGSLYSSGLTDKLGGVKEVVMTKNPYVIRSKNLEGQQYYISEMKFYSTIPDKSNRIELNMDKLGELNISQKGKFGIDETIVLNISTNESFKNLMYCLKWSEMLIFVKSINADKVDGQYDDNYKCYESDAIIDKNHYFLLRINYNMIGPITPQDYIKVSLYDKDILAGQNYTKRQEYLIQDINNI